MSSEWYILNFRKMPPTLDPTRSAGVWKSIDDTSKKGDSSIYKSWIDRFYIGVRDIGNLLSSLQRILLTPEYKSQVTGPTGAIYTAGACLYEVSFLFDEHYFNVNLTKIEAVALLGNTQKSMTSLTSALDTMIAQDNKTQKAKIQEINGQLKAFTNGIPETLQTLANLTRLNNNDAISKAATTV